MQHDSSVDYRPVAFRDLVSGKVIIIGSTVPAKERYVDDEGREYPLVNLETTSDSHPFYTDRQRTVGNHDQIEKFARRFGTKVTGASKQEAAKDAPESTATGSVNSQASTSRQSGRRK